jgi:hypothetical protein
MVFGRFQDDRNSTSWWLLFRFQEKEPSGEQFKYFQFVLEMQ